MGWFGDSPSPPPAPDYAGAATATAAGNLDAARAATAANRVNQFTPYGNLTYSQTPGMGPDGGWNATQTLSPAQQGILDQNNQLNQGLMGTANRGLGYANDVLSRPGVNGWDVQRPGDFGAGAPTTGFNPGQSYQDAMMSRLSPQIDRENNQSDAQLANQGIMQGSDAYKTAKTQLGQQHNDLLNNATVQGLSAGLQANQQKFGQNQAQYNSGLAANQQGFSQAAYNQMQPINVINALRTGSQVSSPSFVNAPQQQTTAGPDMMGAAQGQTKFDLGLYNSQVGANNSMNSTMGTLGAAAIAAF